MKKITTYLAALAIIFLSLVSVVSPVSAQLEFDLSGQAVEQELPGTNNASDADGGFGYWIGRILYIVMVIAALLVLINYIIAALEWTTGGDDKSKIQKAQQRFLQSTIGLIVLSASVALFMILQSFLGINVIGFSNFGGTGTSGGSSSGGGDSSTTCATSGWATCNGVQLNVCNTDLCSNPGAQQCLGSNPGNAGIVTCSYLELPANTCGYYYWKWDYSCGNQGCSNGVCQ